MRRILLILLIMTILIGVVLAIFLIFGLNTPSDAPINEGDDIFPTLKGTNLLLEQKTVPDDLAEGLKLVVVSYDSDQQIYVDKWLKPLEKLNEQYPQLSGYYVPLLPQDTRDAAVAILGGMTLAASGDEDRARTIVVFTDVTAFNDIIGIEGVDEVQLFLLDENNQIRWQGAGAYQYETLQSLEQTLSALTKS